MTRVVHKSRPPKDECVTPNVPRIRGSIFNRKCQGLSAGIHDEQQIPATPKVTAKRKLTPSSRKRSGGPNSGSSRSNCRPNRSRPVCDESFDQDYSTPRVTRSLLTPKADGRIAHLIYRPLDSFLDNESSTESNGSFMRKSSWLDHTARSQNINITPLAIEAPLAEVTLTVHEPNRIEDDSIIDTIEGQSKTDGKNIELIVIDDSDESRDDDRLRSQENKRIKSETPKSQNRCQNKFPAKMVDSSQVITPPITPPEKTSNDSVTLPKLSTFIPGNCNIEEILRLYGSKIEATKDDKPAACDQQTRTK